MDYSTMRRKDLIPIADTRGLATWGTYAEIRARLEAYDAASEPPTPREEPTAMQIAVGDDTGKDNDPGDKILEQAAQAPREPAPKPKVAEVDPLYQRVVEQQAMIAQLQGQLAAVVQGSNKAMVSGEPAAYSVPTSERVFRYEFTLIEGTELTDQLHTSLCEQVVTKAIAAGYRVRGGGRRTAWGVNERGERTAVYEVYARKR